MEFNDRITKVIEYTELTPAEFAEEIGVQRSSISHILSGRNKPSLDFISKIKMKFPKLEWEWLITGEGEMLVNDKPLPKPEDKDTEIDKRKKTSLPDLFSIITDEDFGQSEPKIQNSNNTSESNIPKTMANKKILNDSQPLENPAIKQETNSKKIKRIVFFYQDGTFETYENH